MASSGATHITVDKTNTGLLHLPQTDDAAFKVSELLQKDMERHHTFFNASGFHNHIVHHLLALFSTGASVPSLEQAFRENSAYQLPSSQPNPSIVSTLSSSSATQPPTEYLGKGTNYSSLLAYFKSELSRLGSIQKTLEEHVFSGSPRAEDMMLRLHAGVFHPLIHMMYGIEFSLPSIVAQALAQAAVHKTNQLGDFFASSESMALSRSRSNTGAKMGPIRSLYEQIRSNEKLATAAKFEDDQKIDGVLSRAGDEILDIVAKVKIDESELEGKVLEMYDNALYMAFGSAGWMKGKKEKVDFFFMHHANSSPFYVSLLPSVSSSSTSPSPASSLPDSIKVRLLEWKLRLDLLQYAARGAPSLSLSYLSSYAPVSSKDAFEKLHFLKDDGHTVKLARAVEIYRHVVAEGKKVSFKSNFSEEGEGKGIDDIWGRIMAMIVDSTSRDGEQKWVRSAGMEGAWKGVPDKDEGGEK
ncbi:HypA protein [Zalerion maritima]|uniref:HypA protein n=1 Tax=Zalerion maritima TaxID=339359 RepID=A0AAD5WNS9_9PEZI|nr:HypA protein [Zalerion maritima]